MDSGAVGEKKGLGAVVQIDDGKIRAHLEEVVRATVEEDVERSAGRGGGFSVRCAQV
jgi:hypothetical protein